MNQPVMPVKPISSTFKAATGVSNNSYNNPRPRLAGVATRQARQKRPISRPYQPPIVNVQGRHRGPEPRKFNQHNVKNVNIRPRSVRPPRRNIARQPVNFGKPRNRVPQNNRNIPSVAPRKAVPKPQTPQAKLDLSANCDAKFLSCTINKIPSSNIVLEQSTLPLAAVIHPLAQGKEDIPVVNFGNVGVQRCQKCRAYINPFVVWLDNGRKWQCNFCGTQNATPANYYRHLDNNFDRIDKKERPELCSGCVEIIAPSEYMVRPPMPPVYVFCFEISNESKRTGLLQRTIQTIKKKLGDLPGNTRTQVGFIGYDACIHYFIANTDSDTPSTLTLPDFDDMFLPLPEDLLVNLSENRAAVEKLLDSLEQVSLKVGNENIEQQACLGAALKAAYNLMAHVGGRLSIFAAKLPLIGPGNLTSRGANMNILGTMSEHALLRPAHPVVADKKQVGVSTYYKLKATEFSRQQISCDIFCLPPPQQANYVDLASLSEITKFTAGDLYYYGNCPLSAGLDRLSTDLKRYMSRSMAWEAVMRVRATQGIIPKGFYGNFLLRGNDLIALPSVSCDSTFAVEFAYDAKGSTQNSPGVPLRRDLTGPVTIQTALLYTNSEGERRIRVSTIALPITKSVNEVISSAQLAPIVNLYGRKGVDITFKTGFDDFKRKLQNKLIELMRAYRNFNANIHQTQNNTATEPPNQQKNSASTVTLELVLPPSLQLFPKYVLGILKSQVFRGGNEVPLDQRSYLFDIMFRMNNDMALAMFSPDLYDLSDKIVTVAPSLTNLQPSKVYFYDCGFNYFLWLGSEVSSSVYSELFGLEDVVNIGEPQLATALLHNLGKKSASPVLKPKIIKLITNIKRKRPENPRPGLFVVKQGVGYFDHLFNSLLYYDRQQYSGGTMAYDEFLQFLMQQTQGSVNRAMRR